MTARLLLLLSLLMALACGQVSKEQARRLVARYNEVVCEAYRKNDINLIDPVVGLNTPDGKRLLGLIGVRIDMGLFMDARLEGLEVLSVEESRDQLKVFTRERWRYRDLVSATGQQVGEASEDRYEMVYFFRKEKGAWMVEETKFAAPPQVGRKAVPWSMDAREAHGIFPGPTAGGKK
ncbi:MAG: hypothetical protein HY823_02220 [Acidobacteria bacterium]|nr:hypothetical protein [Acidobacteriota bacterium]